MAKIKGKAEIDWFISKKVKKFRERNGFSQADIARKLKVSTGFIGHLEMESARAKYNLGHLNKLAKIFKCSTKDFFPRKPL